MSRRNIAWKSTVRDECSLANDSDNAEISWKLQRRDLHHTAAEACKPTKSRAVRTMAINTATIGEDIRAELNGCR